ncbi:MAG: efflux RND transporter periplasmic adaptor subunit [Acidimicrobiia bacterium]|nr:efflux RND transporter periplasmic adaptor subunit [Acidimicrobiia bacterium]
MPNLKDELAALKIERPAERRTRPWLKWLKWIVVLLVLGAVGTAGARYASRPRPVEVETAPVVQRAVGAQAAVLNASGYVTARRRATVSSKITGKVMEVNVEEGMAIKEGQVLARLDDAQFRASLALAEAQAEAARRSVRESEVRLAEARVVLGRSQTLVADKLVTAAELDTAQAQVDSLVARIDASREQVRVTERQIEVERTNLDNTVVRAPFSGIAVSKDAQPGEMVSPVSAGGGFTRTGICTIVDMRSLEIEVDVNESYINRVQDKQPVAAVLNAYPDWQIPARVITTVPKADRQKATVLVRIGFEKLDPRILPDMGVKVTFLKEAEATVAAQQSARPVMLVPKGAIKTENDTSYAFVVVNGVVDRRAVTVGGVDGDRTEVLDGLNSGERVIVSPAANISAGLAVVPKAGG